MLLNVGSGKVMITLILVMLVFILLELTEWFPSKCFLEFFCNFIDMIRVGWKIWQEFIAKGGQQ
jgi:hypothetical protein